MYFNGIGYACNVMGHAWVILALVIKYKPGSRVSRLMAGNCFAIPWVISLTYPILKRCLSSVR